MNVDDNQIMADVLSIIADGVMTHKDIVITLAKKYDCRVRDVRGRVDNALKCAEDFGVIKNQCDFYFTINNFNPQEMKRVHTLKRRNMRQFSGLELIDEHTRMSLLNPDSPNVFEGFSLSQIFHGQNHVFRNGPMILNIAASGHLKEKKSNLSLNPTPEDTYNMLQEVSRKLQNLNEADHQ